MEYRLQTCRIVHWNCHSVLLPGDEKICGQIFAVFVDHFSHFIFYIHDYIPHNELAHIFSYGYIKSRTELKLNVNGLNTVILNSRIYLLSQVNVAGWFLSATGYVVGFYFSLMFKQDDDDITAIAVESNIPNEGDCIKTTSSKTS